MTRGILRRGLRGLGEALKAVAKAAGVASAAVGRSGRGGTAPVSDALAKRRARRTAYQRAYRAAKRAARAQESGGAVVDVKKPKAEP